MSDRHRLLALAAAVHVTRAAPHWFSHETAAMLWGCDLAPVPTTVDVTGSVNSQVKGNREAGVRRHWTSRTDRLDEVRHDLGLPVSSLERTVLDCASSLPVGRALVIADSALRLGADPLRLAHMITRAGGDRGIRRARRVVTLADARSESAGETLVRHAIVDAGLPAPEPQVAVRTRLGWRWVDLGWRDAMVAVEFDGRGKYGDVAAAVVAAFAEERRRQAAIEDEGWQVIRFTWEDLARPQDLTDRVARTLRRAAYRRRGSAVSSR
ncbi:type IV toxin-antitoxin system AbiEi family antitoxin domain-containing protein [Cellulomonas sp. Marseille-Q8402]